jgi:Tol biopolymer transport system component
MFHFPQWAPDGRTILVSAVLDGDSELYLLPIDGGPKRQLTNNTANDDRAEWVDDGRAILFMSDRRGREELFVMDADGSNQRPAARPRPERTSPDGRTRIVESVEQGVAILTAVSPDGTRRTLTSGPSAEQGSYAPDGRRIVYEQRAASAPDDIAGSNVVVANADGREPHVVASGTDPSWSPSGDAILFKTLDTRTKVLWIATVRPEGAALQRLAPGVHPHWSPDGQWIAFMQEDAIGRTNVMIMTRTGRDRKCLTCR